MTDSLYKIYRKFRQRARRNPDDLELQSISSSISEIIKDLYNSSDNTENHLSIKSNAKIIAKEIYNRETATAPKIIFSLELIKALNRKNIDYDIPYYVIHRWNSEDSKGLIYILTSKSKQGLCKLGATTLSMQKRIHSYQSRYGYSVEEYYSKEITSPLQFESILSKKMKEYRVSGNTNGESNEWYSCKPSFMKSKIILELKTFPT